MTVGLLVEPYKGEILPHWQFKQVVEAKKSSAKRKSHQEKYEQPVTTGRINRKAHSARKTSG